MKPDWDELGETFENSKKVLIGDVDCTTDGGKPLCEKYGIDGYPTIKYFNPPDTDGEVYEGERDLQTLKKFAKKLGPACTVGSLNKCSKKQKEALQPYLETPREELVAKMDEMKGRISSMQASHDALLKDIQAKFDMSEKALKQLKADLEPSIKLIKSAIPVPTGIDDATKDEV